MLVHTFPAMHTHVFLITSKAWNFTDKKQTKKNLSLSLKLFLEPDIPTPSLLLSWGNVRAQKERYLEITNVQHHSFKKDIILRKKNSRLVSRSSIQKMNIINRQLNLFWFKSKPYFSSVCIQIFPFNFFWCGVSKLWDRTEIFHHILICNKNIALHVVL